MGAVEIVSDGVDLARTQRRDGLRVGAAPQKGAHVGDVAVDNAGHLGAHRYPGDLHTASWKRRWCWVTSCCCTRNGLEEEVIVSATRHPVVPHLGDDGVNTGQARTR